MDLDDLWAMPLPPSDEGPLESPHEPSVPNDEEALGTRRAVEVLEELFGGEAAACARAEKILNELFGEVPLLGAAAPAGGERSDQAAKEPQEEPQRPTATTEELPAGGEHSDQAAEDPKEEPQPARGALASALPCAGGGGGLRGGDLAGRKGMP